MYKKSAAKLYYAALKNAVNATEDNDDSAFRRICIYFVCTERHISYDACSLEKQTSAANAGHDIADKIINKHRNDNDPCEPPENVDEVLTENITESSNTDVMSREFDISKAAVITIFSLLKKDIASCRA